MRVAATILALLLALVLLPLGVAPAEAAVSPDPYADPEYIDSAEQVTQS